MSNFVSISEAAALLGVSTKTIRRSEKVCRLKSTRTEDKHRRFEVCDLLGNKQAAALTIANKERLLRFGAISYLLYAKYLPQK